MNAKVGATGGFYRDDAARLASEAARQPDRPVGSVSQPAAIAPAVLLDEPARPPLRPGPARNQNTTPALGERFEETAEPRRHLGFGRILAWLLLAPLYAATAVASIGLDAMFVKELLGF